MSNTLQLVLLPTRALFLSHTGTPNPLFLMARLISALSHLTYEGCYKVDEDNQVILERMLWTVNTQLQ